MSENQNGGKNRRAGLVAGVCAAVVVGMVGMSYAAVPLYRIFCAVTGYAGTTQRAEAASDTVLDREITIRFDANVSRDLPWDIRPEERKVKLRIGETGTAFYLAKNTSGTDFVSTSSFNVSPPQAGLYFNKIDCFCFTEQPLKAGEQKEMGVTFFVDPALVEDDDTRGLSEITLSYTFFPAEGQTTSARGDAAGPTEIASTADSSAVRN